MRALVGILVAVGLLVACGDDDQGTDGSLDDVDPRGDVSRDVSPDDGHGYEISRADYGDAWPLTVDSGRVRCEGSAFVFSHDGTDYAINSIAAGSGYSDINPIWAEHPDGGRIDLEPLYDAALEHC